MGGQRDAPAAYPWERPLPIVQEAGCAPGPVRTGAKNFVATGILSPDRPAVASRSTHYAIPTHELLVVAATDMSNTT